MTTTYDQRPPQADLRYSELAEVTGMHVTGDIHMTVWQQLRFPRSKRHRIRKKWAKRGCNGRTIPDPQVAMLGMTRLLVGHPDTLFKVQRLMREGADYGKHISNRK